MPHRSTICSSFFSSFCFVYTEVGLIDFSPSPTSPIAFLTVQLFVALPLKRTAECGLISPLTPPSARIMLFCVVIPCYQPIIRRRVISPLVYIRRFVSFASSSYLFVHLVGWFSILDPRSVPPIPSPPRHDNAFVCREQHRNKALSSFHAAKHLYICMFSTLQSFVEATGRVFG